MKPDFRTAFLFLVLLAGVSLNSCFGPARLAYRNIATFYHPDFEMKDLSFEVFNLNDTLSNLYIKFPFPGLTYTTGKGTPAANYRLHYEVFEGYESSRIVDSATFSGVDSLGRAGYFFDSVLLVLPERKNYTVHVVLQDVISGKNHGKILEINKQAQHSAAGFLLCNEDGIPLMRNYLYKGEKVRLRHAVASQVWLYHHPGEQVAAAPPFAFAATPDFQAGDSLLKLVFSNSFSNTFSLSEYGIYFIPDGPKPFVIHRFYDGFPEISNPGVMRESLRYISAEAEYQAMFDKPARAAVDEFWVKVTGHPERALSQIRRYYKRVEEANRFFSVAAEGWKSDRGMIYLVYGPPAVVYRTQDSEEWTYGEAGNPMSVRFLFNLNVNRPVPDFEMLRSENYRNTWNMAVSNWRR